MNTNEILKRLKIMLSLEEEKSTENVEATETKEEVVEEKMRALATLVDGTEVFVMEGDIAPGSILNVVTEGEEQLLAPEGIHETVDGLIVTVGVGGEIISVETKADEVEVEAGYKDKDEDEKEEKMETVEVEIEPEVAEPTEDLLNGMAELLKPFIEEIKELSEEFKTIKARFEKIADEPASDRIKTKFSSTKVNLDEVEKKIEILKKIKKENKK